MSVRFKLHVLISDMKWHDKVSDIFFTSTNAVSATEISSERLHLVKWLLRSTGFWHHGIVGGWQLVTARLLTSLCYSFWYKSKRRKIVQVHGGVLPFGIFGFFFYDRNFENEILSHSCFKKLFVGCSMIWGLCCILHFIMHYTTMSMAFKMWTCLFKGTFPLCIHPSQMCSGQERLAESLDFISICLVLHMAMSWPCFPCAFNFFQECQSLKIAGPDVHSESYCPNKSPAFCFDSLSTYTAKAKCPLTFLNSSS